MLLCSGSCFRGSLSFGASTFFQKSCPSLCLSFFSTLFFFLSLCHFVSFHDHNAMLYGPENYQITQEMCLDCNLAIAVISGRVKNASNATAKENATFSLHRKVQAYDNLLFPGLRNQTCLCVFRAFATCRRASTIYKVAKRVQFKPASQMVIVMLR